MRKLLTAVTAATIMLCAPPGFTQPADELEALKKDIRALKDQHTANLKELQEIKSVLGLKPKQQEAPRPLAETRGGTVGSLDDRQRAALVRALAAQPAGTPVWLAVYEQDPAAREFARALRAAFGEAGWVVRGMRGVPFTINSGVFLFAADERPPAYVETVQEALASRASGRRLRPAIAPITPRWRGRSRAGAASS